MNTGNAWRALVLAGVVALPACERGEEVRATRARAGSELGPVRTSELTAGPAFIQTAVRNPYAGDPHAEREGHNLYLWMNCHGCHGEFGGGGIGPPFADTEWIYGGSPEQIYQSIAQGRPNGMPSYGAMIPEDRIWMIVAYVQSISGQEAAATGVEHPTTSGGQGAPQQTGSSNGTSN